MIQGVSKSISILGIRGIPANHGGFETFAEGLALYLVSRGWNVTVYCQVEGKGECWADVWRGVNRVTIPVVGNGAFSTFKFDWLSSSHAAKNENGLVCTLGYNTAVFNIKYQLRNITNVVNMDGIEWQRQKWSSIEKIWFYVNELVGCLTGTVLVADHPRIKSHLLKRYSKTPIVTIPYGAKRIEGSGKSLEKYSLNEKGFATLIARPEPENSIYEIVKAFSNAKRNIKLVVLGDFDAKNSYHNKVLDCASDEVQFLGAIYDHEVVQDLRAGSLFYMHGHQVGGTNPSLVEALGAGNPVIAHDNDFNRYVAGGKALYFSSVESCEERIKTVLNDDSMREEMRCSSLKLHQARYTLPKIHAQYEYLFHSILGGSCPSDADIENINLPNVVEYIKTRQPAPV